MKLQVRVVYLKKRSRYVLRWRDPESNEEHQETTAAATRAEALKLAGELEAKLREGRYDNAGRIVWAHARRRFEDEKLTQLSGRTVEKYKQTLNEIERVVGPKRISDIDASSVSILQAKLRARGLRVPTIRSKLAHAKAFLNWCEEVGLIRKAPRIKMPSLRGVGKKMRGRALTDTEFARLLDAVQPVVGTEWAPTWRHYLRGMWLSGLRRQESLHLYWDSEEALRIDFTGKRPMLLVSAEYEKGGKDRRVPLTPDFAEFLEETPEEDRIGRVFRLPGRAGEGYAEANWVGQIVARISKRASIVVDTRGNRKHASLHDLRRSFGVRWAERVPVHVLRELMRHESLSTTMDFYVGQDADRTAELLWKEAA